MDGARGTCAASERQALLSELESGKRNDTPTSVLRRLARTLGVSMDDLAGLYDDEDAPARLTTLVVHLNQSHTDMQAHVQPQDAINERLVGAIERLDVSVARLEALTARVFRQGDNG